MSLKEIHLENIQSFRGRHEVKIPSGLVVIAGENMDNEAADVNRIGKTAFTNCIPLCLYGKTALVSRPGKLVNISEDSAFVKLLFDDFSVARYINDKKFKNAILFNDKEITQERLLAEIAIDFNPFISTVFFGTAYSDFLDKALNTPVEAKKILTDLIPKLEQFDLAWKKVDGILKDFELVKRGLEIDLASKRGELEGLMVKFTNRESYKEKSIAFENERNQNISKLEKEKAPIQSRLSQLKKERETFQREWNNVTGKISDLELEIKELSREHNRSEEEIRNLNKRKKEVLDELTIIRADQRCPKCDQKLPKPEELLRQTKMEYSSIETKLKSIRIDPLKTRIHELEKTLGILDEEDKKFVKKDRALESDIFKLATDLTVLQNQVRFEMNKENPFKDLGEINKKQIDDLEKEIKGIEIKTKKSMELLPYYDTLYRTFGSRGIKNFVFDEILYDLTDRSRPYLDFMTNNSIDIHFSPRKEKQKGGFTETMSLEISDRFGSRDTFYTWSTSERKKISLSVDLGMNRILTDMFQSPFDFMVFDETFDGLDQIGRFLFYDLIQYELKRLNTIFVVTHETHPEHIPHSVIFITKKNGISKAEVIDGI